MPVTKKSAPKVARAVIEGEEIFFIGRTFVNSALCFEEMGDFGRPWTVILITLQAAYDVILSEAKNL
jgi:hypothetical protein